MNGISVVRVPKFMEGDTLPEGYYSAPDPYSEPPASKYNLRAMVNYARKNRKKVADLTKEEAEMFIISKNFSQEAKQWTSKN